MNLYCFLVGQWEELGGASKSKELTPSLTPQKPDIPGPPGADFPPMHHNEQRCVHWGSRAPGPRRKPTYWSDEEVTGPLIWEVTSLQVSHPEIPNHGNKAKQGHRVEETNSFLPLPLVPLAGPSQPQRIPQRQKAAAI